MFKIFNMNRPTIVLTVAGHIVFWLLNYWLVAIRSQFNWNGFTYASGSLAYAYSYGLFFNAALFYAQVFWLFPKVYVSNKKLKFYIFSILIIIVISVIETYVDHILYYMYDVRTEETLGSFSTNILFHILYSIAGFYYILKFEYRKTEKLRQQLVEETYKTELKYLKAQLNPHFLFNGINSVYHLIGKNNELAKDTLLQFSELLRYQLYESRTYILLEKELDYVSQYIKIEETRRGSDIRLQYDIAFENHALKIAPLLLIPFVENAFKHCSNHADDTKNRINIKITEAGGELTLKTINNYDTIIEDKPTGGIGLNNAQRRLSLLYPDAHQLEISKVEDNFIVDLIINL